METEPVSAAVISSVPARVSSHLGRGRRPVVHIRVLQDVASARLHRTAGQLACGSDSRRPLEIEDQPYSEIDCPKCKAVKESLARRGVTLAVAPAPEVPVATPVDRLALVEWLTREIYSHGCYAPAMLDELAPLGIRHVKNTLRAEGNEVEDGVHFDSEYRQHCFEGWDLVQRLCRLLGVAYVPANGRGTQMRLCLDALRASTTPKAS